MNRGSIKNTDKEILVSVIITTFRRPDSLERAIQSVDDQTLDNIEIIVVDDNNPSTSDRKDTEELIKELQTSKSLVYLKHEKNMNGATARNTGISAAKGKYIAFLDDDDYYYAEKLEKQVKLMQEASDEYGGSYSGFDVFCNGKRREYGVSVKSGNFLFETLACTFQMGSGSNLFIRKDIVNELNGFDTNFKRHQDYEFLVRFFEKYKLAAIDEPLFAIEQNNAQSNKQNLNNYIITKHQYLSKYSRLIKTFQYGKQRKIYWNHRWQLMKMCIQQRKLISLIRVLFLKL